MKIIKKILKWMSILILFLIVIPIGFYGGINKYELYKANNSLKALYAELVAGMYMGDVFKKTRVTQANIHLWNPAEEGSQKPIPVGEEIDTSKNYCVLIPHETSYAFRDAVRIGIVLDSNTRDCYHDNAKTQDMYLLSSSNKIIEKKLSREKDYKTAIDFDKKRCELGKINSCNNLAVRYRNGEDSLFSTAYVVPQDYKKSFSYSNKACSLGSSTGCADVGWLYYYGKGVPENNTKAKEYYGKACSISKDETGSDCINYNNLKGKQ